MLRLTASVFKSYPTTTYQALPSYRCTRHIAHFTAVSFCASQIQGEPINTRATKYVPRCPSTSSPSSIPFSPRSSPSDYCARGHDAPVHGAT